jgi:hypothetical protein
MVTPGVPAEWHPAVRIDGFGWHAANGSDRPADYFRMSWCVNLAPVAVRGCMRSLFRFSGPDGWCSVVLMKARRPDQPPTRQDWQKWPLEFSGIPTTVAERRRAEVEREWLEALYDLLGGAMEVSQSSAESAVGRTLRRYIVRTPRWQDMNRVQEAATAIASAGGTATRPFGDASPPRDWDGYTPFLVDLTLDQSNFPHSTRTTLPGGTWGDMTVIFRPCDTTIVIDKPA